MLSVIVPCRDEEANLRLFSSLLIPSLNKLAADYEIIAVDDGSVDGSSGILRELSRGAPVRVVRHPRSLGLGAAIRSGLAAAAGEWILTLDADMSFSPEDIRGMLERQKQTKTDAVFGSPFLLSGGTGSVSWRRRIPSAILNAAYRLLLDPRLTAYTPIFRLYRAELLRAMPLESRGFEINAEIAARLILSRRRIEEIPTPLFKRELGSSKLRTLPEIGRHARLLFMIAFARKKSFAGTGPETAPLPM